MKLENHWGQVWSRGTIGAQCEVWEPLEAQCEVGEPLGARYEVWEPLGTQYEVGEPLEAQSKAWELLGSQCEVPEIPLFSFELKLLNLYALYVLRFHDFVTIVNGEIYNVKLNVKMPNVRHPTT